MTVAARSLKRPLRAAARPPVRLADEGIVTAIVAVTNHEDSVQDILAPGTFEKTLKVLWPKLCWHHDWKDPLGRVLHIVELRPGDKRLPVALPDGRAWPKEAGALVATMQFNLRTVRGREMFEHAKEWAKNGEAAFSIGYKVADGMASKRADGVRIIYELHLYEVSLVLHGAHNMALALEVKDLDGAGAPDLETKDSPTGITEVKAAEPMIGSGAMVALYLSPEVAEQVAVADGNPAEELHVTLAFLGDGDAAGEISDPAAVARELGDHIAGTPVLSGTIGGIGVFPEGDAGTPVWVPVDVPGLIELQQAVTSGVAAAGFPQQSEHGYTPHVTLGYDLPSLDPVPSTPVTFDQAVLVVGSERFPIPLGGSAVTPMEGKAAAAVMEARSHVAGLEGKSAAAAVLEAKTLFSGSAGAVTVQALGEPEKVPAATRTPRKKDLMEGQETKMMSSMKGSHEERREALRSALEKLLLPKEKPTPGSESPEACGWLSIEATFDDHVLVTVEKGRDNESFMVSYSIDPADSDKVTLGKPSKVELSVVAIPDGDSEPEEVEEGDAIAMRYLDPATVMLKDATQRIAAMPEGKSLASIDGPLLSLIDALSVKGYDVAAAVMGDETDPDDEGLDEDPVDADGVGDAELEDPDDVDLDADDDPEEPDPAEDTVSVDPEQVRADLAELNA